MPAIPVPKSSTAMRAPATRMPSNCPSSDSPSRWSRPSCTSRVSSRPGIAASLSARRTSSSRSPRLNWLGATFTLTGSSMPARAHDADWRHASRSAQLPISASSPASSAMASRRVAGIASPVVGRFQRISASAAIVSPVAILTIGW